MGAPSRPVFEQVLARMYQREGIDTLPLHLQDNCGIAVETMTQLDVGVFRVDRRERATPLVARVFSKARAHASAAGDLAVLRYLAEIGFPAERPFGDAALTSHEGQAVLVTEFIRQVPKPERPPHSIVRLGAMVGRLHGLRGPDEAARPAGALHHYAEGTMADELRAVTGWLGHLDDRVPDTAADALYALRAAVIGADGGDGLPEGLVHPDPVPKNVIFTAGGPRLVDWTGAGRGPRLPSMTLMLRSGWAGLPFLKGYARVNSLTDEERDRLAGLLFSRQLIGLCFGVCRDPSTAVRAAGKLTGMRAACDGQARELLSGLQSGP